MRSSGGAGCPIVGAIYAISPDIVPSNVYTVLGALLADRKPIEGTMYWYLTVLFSDGGAPRVTQGGRGGSAGRDDPRLAVGARQ